MYCPSCAQTYSNGFTRCPECHGWLKDENPSGAPDAEDDWNIPWGSKKDEAPKLPAVDEEWLNTPDVEIAEGESSDDWLDNDFDDEEEVLGLSPTGTEYVGAPGERILVVPSTQRQFVFLTAVALLCIVAIGVLFNQVKTDPNTAPSSAPPSTAQRKDAELWINSAQESMEKGDYELASAQLRKGIQFLEDADASVAEIEKARLELGKSLILEGRLEQAHGVLTEIKLPSQTQSEVAALEKSLRVEGNELLKKARSNLAVQPDKARAQAEKALRLFQKYNGQDSQVAAAHEMVGKSYLAEGNNAAAAMAYRKALDTAYSEERQQVLNKIAPRRPVSRPQTVEATSTRPPKLELIPPASRIPTAEPVRPRQPEIVETPFESDGTDLDTGQTQQRRPSPTQRPTNSSYSPSSSDLDRPGEKDVLPGYNSSGSSSSGLPGY